MSRPRVVHSYQFTIKRTDRGRKSQFWMVVDFLLDSSGVTAAICDCRPARPLSASAASTLRPQTRGSIYCKSNYRNLEDLFQLCVSWCNLTSRRDPTLCGMVGTAGTCHHGIPAHTNVWTGTALGRPGEDNRLRKSVTQEEGFDRTAPTALIWLNYETFPFIYSALH
ncbi:hypothetical protein J6590_055881 [Homalodisca vitripennis]|nr:hypothetical protein J6590_055881 [Homalodisca vitripennis]